MLEGKTHYPFSRTVPVFEPCTFWDK